MDFAMAIKLQKLERDVDDLAAATAKLAKTVELMRTNLDQRLRRVETTCYGTTDEHLG